MKQRLGPEAYRIYIITMSRVANALVGLREDVGFNQGKVSNDVRHDAEVILTLSS
jgi:hypothetical protein